MTSKAIGETNLDQLIRSMEPSLHPDTFVFTTFASSPENDRINENQDFLALNPVMMFKEAEGVTLILPQGTALEKNIDFEFPCRMITLNIHSSLDAVGFLARITQRLAALDMGVNPVSGFFHDHLFVPKDKADEAMSELRRMSRD